MIPSHSTLDREWDFQVPLVQQMSGRVDQGPKYLSNFSKGSNLGT